MCPQTGMASLCSSGAGSRGGDARARAALQRPGNPKTRLGSPRVGGSGCETWLAFLPALLLESPRLPQEPEALDVAGSPARALRGHGSHHVAPTRPQLGREPGQKEPGSAVGRTAARGSVSTIRNEPPLSHAQTPLLPCPLAPKLSEAGRLLAPATVLACLALSPSPPGAGPSTAASPLCNVLALAPSPPGDARAAHTPCQR